MGESSAKKAAYQPLSPIRPLIHRCGGPPSPKGKVGEKLPLRAVPLPRGGRLRSFPYGRWGKVKDIFDTFSKFSKRLDFFHGIVYDESGILE